MLKDVTVVSKYSGVNSSLKIIFPGVTEIHKSLSRQGNIVYRWGERKTIVNV